MARNIARLSAEFQRALAVALRELRDPRLSAMASVTHVDVTSDLMHAKVQVSVFGTPEEQKQSIEVLNNAQGKLAESLNHSMKLRRIPQLHFVLDTSMEYSAHISQIMNDLAKQRSTNDNT